jgi:cytochrome c biogenesis protein ResB
MAVFPDAKTIAKVNSDGSIDPTQTNYGPGGTQARNPVVQLQLYVGDLGLQTGQPQNVNQLDTSKMQPYFSDAHPLPVALGETVPFSLPGAGGTSATFTISFTQLRHYSLFLVKKDSGVPFVYVTFVMAMLGLLAKLYLRPFLEARDRRRKRDAYPEALAEISGKPRDWSREPVTSSRGE